MPRIAGNESSNVHVLDQGSISRRDVLTGLVGAAGGIGAWQMIGSQEAAAQSGGTLPDSEWMTMLQVAQNNSRNQAVLIKPNKGMIVTFGNSLFQLLPDFSFSLSEGQAQVFSGNSRRVVTGNLDRLQVGNRFTQFDTVQSSDGRSVVIQTDLQPIDDLCNFQINIAVSPADGPASFRLSAIYNFCNGFFPSGIQTEGVLPNFNFVPIGFLGRTIARNFNFRGAPSIQTETGIALNQPSSGTTAPPPTPPPQPPPKSFWEKLADAVVVGLTVALMGGFSPGADLLGLVVGIGVFVFADQLPF